MESFFKKPDFQELGRRAKSYKKKLTKSLKEQRAKFRGVDVATFSEAHEKSFQWLDSKRHQAKKTVSAFYRHAHGHWGKGMDWYRSLSHQHRLFLIIVIAFVGGIGIKFVADQVVSNGYQDASTRHQRVTLDLNEVEKRQLEKQQSLSDAGIFPICSL